MHARFTVCLTLLALGGCRAAAAPPDPAPAPFRPASGAGDPLLEREVGDHRATWTLSFENDLYFFTDENYSTGMAISRASPEVGTLAEGNWQRRLVDWASFLPGVGAEGSENYLLLSLAQTMFTPDDLDAPDPPLDDRPYAGLLFVDTGILSQARDWVQVWNLKLGVVGPSAGGETTQNWTHDLFKQDEARGWDTQLEDEPIVNLDYQYARRWRSGPLGDDLDYQVLPNLGAALGNYTGFVNAGLSGSVGIRCPDASVPRSLRAGVGNPARIGATRDDDWSVYLHGNAQAYAVGWFLPLDGNTFRDSRSVDSEDFVGAATMGLGIARWGYLLNASVSVTSDTFEGQDDLNRWAAVSLSFSP